MVRCTRQQQLSTLLTLTDGSQNVVTLFYGTQLSSRLLSYVSLRRKKRTKK